MPKGQRKPRNPIEKLMSCVAQMENTVQSVLDNADKPEFVNSIIALRKKKEEENNKKSTINDEAREVVKQLQKYPGLSKQSLSFLRSKISEYKTLNILSKYETEPIGKS